MMHGQTKIKFSASSLCYYKVKHFKYLHELPDDDSLGVETCSNVERRLLNWVVLDWRVYVAVCVDTVTEWGGSE